MPDLAGVVLLDLTTLVLVPFFDLIVFAEVLVSSTSSSEDLSWDVLSRPVLPDVVFAILFAVVGVPNMSTLVLLT